MFKVLIADAPLAMEVFRENGIEAEVATGLSAEELQSRIGDYDGLAVRSATKVSEEALATAERLKVVGRAGIGIDNIDLDAATARGVVVMNAPHGNAITTAEHTIALLFALARQIPAADRSTQSGKWEKSRFMGVELTGKRLGVVGCGNIGSIVARRAQALKMKVVAFDPYLSPERAGDLGVEKLEWHDLLANVDFITLHVPLTDETRGLIDAAAIARMKPGVRIINCARGGLVVEEDLKTALGTGQVAGAALDVFAQEPARDNTLFGLDNVIATPHLGASTSEAQEKVAVQIAEQMSAYLTKGSISNALNMPSLTAEEAQRLGPYMKLAEQLGSFAGQLTRSGLRKVSIEYEGDVAGLNHRPLTQTALAALLRPILDSVNLVNAPVLARERLIRLTVTTERGDRSVAGTLFGGRKPRLVEIKGIPIEAELTPYMLYITNEDKAGFIGALGTVLGDAGVNIATFHLGRNKPGGDALALVELDEEIDAQVLEAVRRLPHIKRARPIRF
jgi:D-3-phosphoglycerate dehydrogenase